MPIWRLRWAGDACLRSCIFGFSGRAVGILDAGQSSDEIRIFEQEYAQSCRHPGILQRLLGPPGYLDFGGDELYGMPGRV